MAAVQGGFDTFEVRTKMRLVTSPSKEAEKKAQNLVSRVFSAAVLLTLPAQFYFEIPAVISILWSLNTFLTLSFSGTLHFFPKLFKMPNVSEEQRRVALEAQEVLQRMQERQARLPVNLS